VQLDGLSRCPGNDSRAGPCLQGPGAHAADPVL